MENPLLSALELEPTGQLRRDMPRPHQFRQEGYESDFDFSTIFYDCFRSVDRRFVVLIGPPLLNLGSHVLPRITSAFGITKSSHGSFQSLKNHDQIWLRTENARALLAPGLFGQELIQVQPNRSRQFEKRKVLFTISKDNDLVWIKDWVRFFAANHRTNAVLLYDNMSVTYEPGKVQEVISKVKGIDVACVVEWPFKFGPQGGPHEIWDSNFTQHAVFEHARHRFLASAESAINADIDEFVITEDGRSLHDLVLTSQTGYLRYGGHWIENATLAKEEIRRHVHYAFRSVVSNEPVGRKWTVMPKRCPTQSQWLVHYISGMEPDPRSTSVSTRHFKAINSNWRWARSYSEEPNERTHVVDHELVKWMHHADEYVTSDS